MKKKSEKNYKDWKSTNEKVDNYYLKNAKFRLKKVYKYLDIEYKTTRRGLKYVQINYIPVTKPQSQNPEFVNVGYEDEKDLQIIGKALKLKLLIATFPAVAPGPNKKPDDASVIKSVSSSPP